VNQLDHPILDRHIVKDYLMTLTKGVTMQQAASRSYEEQYHWLLEQIDQASELERKFLDHLFIHRHRLPDRAQYRPEEGIFAEADFFCERGGLPGAAVFCDGPDHDLSGRRSHDQTERAKLENLGYRVIVVRYDRDIAAQVAEHPDVFGLGRV
jgi:very-short-patch-repair endonuclease